MREVRFLQVEPTTRCNYRCKFCCGRHLEQIDMEFDTFRAVIDNFPHLKHLELQGEGEPFLNAYIFDMVAYARMRDIKVSTITNGSMFNSQNVDLILRSGFEIIMVSIESPDPAEFNRIRGGDIEKVRRGIAYMIAERDKRCLSRPVVGFSVTVMNSTMSKIPDLFELYRSLNMDGGIHLQNLSKLPVYTQYYDNDLLQEIPSRQYDYVSLLRMLKEIKINKDAAYFYDELGRHAYSLLYPGEKMTCKWLLCGMYINAHGFATACCQIKDYKSYSFGNIIQQNAKELISIRDKLTNEFQNGNIPIACRACYHDGRNVF